MYLITICPNELILDDLVVFPRCGRLAKVQVYYDRLAAVIVEQETGDSVCTLKTLGELPRLVLRPRTLFPEGQIIRWRREASEQDERSLFFAKYRHIGVSQRPRVDFELWEREIQRWCFVMGVRYTPPTLNESCDTTLGGLCAMNGSTM